MVERKNITLKNLASLVGGEIVGDPEIVISNLADVDNAESGDITFIVNKSYLDSLNKSGASAVIAPPHFENLPLPVIRVEDVNLASAIIHDYLLMEPFEPKGIHQTVHVGENCILPDLLTIGPMVVLGNEVRLGERVVIEAGVIIGNDVEIGEDSFIAANVTIASGCRVGKRTRIQSGTVLGSDGFGYATDARGQHFKRPQVGNVIIGDDVEIGANVCIDRATFGSTIVGNGCKIDNLVQIAHNVEVGENSILVSQTGIAGSSKLGRNVVLAGRAAVSDHVVLGDRVMVGAMSGVNKDQKSGAVVSGMPAIPHKMWLKAVTAFNRLPGFINDLKELKKKVKDLEAKIKL